MTLLAIPPAAANDVRGIAVTAAETDWESLGMYRRAVALVVGVSDYADDTLDLDLARRDAEGVASTLRDFYAFDRIDTLYDADATRAGVMSALQKLGRELTSDDALFVFYAGHGATEGQPPEQVGYLVPHDGAIDPEAPGWFNNIPMNWLRTDALHVIQARHVFFVADACYAGVLTKRGIAVEKARRDKAYIEAIIEPRMRIVLTAGSDGQQVLDGGPNGHSVFTGEFIQALKGADTWITGLEVAAAVRDAVTEAASLRGHLQVPEYDRFEGSGGDFVFVAKQSAQELEALALELAERSRSLEAAGDAQEVARLERQQQDLDQRLALLRKREGQQALAEQRRQQREAEAAALALERQRLEREQAALRRKETRARLGVLNAREALSEAFALDRRVEQLQSHAAAVFAEELAELERKRTEFETDRDYAAREKQARILKNAVVPMSTALASAPLQGELTLARNQPVDIPPPELTVDLGRYDLKARQWPDVTLHWRPPGVDRAATAKFRIGETDGARAERLSQAVAAGEVVLSARVQPTFRGARRDVVLVRDLTLQDAEGGVWRGHATDTGSREGQVDDTFREVVACDWYPCFVAGLSDGRTLGRAWNGRDAEVSYLGPRSTYSAVGLMDELVVSVSPKQLFVALQRVGSANPLLSMKLKKLRPVGVAVGLAPVAAEGRGGLLTNRAVRLRYEPWVFDGRKGEIFAAVQTGPGPADWTLTRRFEVPDLVAVSRPDAAGRVVLVTKFGELHLFDPNAGTLGAIGETEGVRVAFELNATGTTLLTCEPRSCVLHDLTTGKSRRVPADRIDGAALSPDGTLLALGGEGRVTVLNTSTLEPVGMHWPKTNGASLPLTTLAFIDGGRALVASAFVSRAERTGAEFAELLSLGLAEAGAEATHSWVVGVPSMGSILAGWDRWPKEVWEPLVPVAEGRTEHQLDARDGAGLRLVVRGGDVLRVSISGEVTGDPRGRVESCAGASGPGGMPSCEHATRDPSAYRGLPFMAAIARVDGRWQLVGDGAELTPLYDGEVVLMTNDAYHRDNHGRFEVVVERVAGG